MIKDITIGQYYRSDSILHRLDPRVKLVGTLIFVITLFFSKSLLTYAASLLYTGRSDRTFWCHQDHQRRSRHSRLSGHKAGDACIGHFPYDLYDHTQ